MGRLLPAALVLLTVLGAPVASRAAWQSPGAGGQSARAITLPAGATPSASVSNRSVTVSWTATALPGGGAAGGYVVRRYSSGGVLQSIGSGCAGTVAATSCTEAGVPPGSWRYSIEPRQGNWLGSEGSRSPAATVAGPGLAISAGSPVGTLPANLSAALSGFAQGQTVTYRLDDAATGTVLSGTTSPSTIPAAGSATASVTIPSGTTGGSHTLYAIGSAGDVASAAFTVDSSVTTGAWSVNDSTSGTGTDSSAEPAFAGDGLAYRTERFDNAFSTARYVELDMNAPLPAGQLVVGGTFNFRFAAQAGGQTACFYVELRRASTGATLSTHGSAGVPLGCVTGTTQQTFSTALAPVTTSALANDLRVRVYVSQSSSRAIDIDLATVSGIAGLAPFTLHATAWTDAADGSPAATTWPLAAEDASAFETASSWPNAFTAGRHLEVGFPAYVPAAASVRGATLRHVWRPTSSGLTACWYAETWSGGVLIGSHGSAAAPISCRTGAAFGTDTLSLPEVDTPARANGLTVRIHVRIASGVNRRTQHDAVELSVAYGS